MFFRMIYDDKLAQAAYLIGCQKTGEAIVIDPERDVDRYIRIAQAEKLRIIAVTETHIHADFLSGTRELAEKTGAKVLLSDEGGPGWQYAWQSSRAAGGAYPHQLLHNGDGFRIGNIGFTVVHTPGHTPEHICFLVTDSGGGANDPMGIITGDFVFVGDLGRPDLLETAAGMAGTKDASARLLWQSAKRFAGLPDWLQVWPAHGAGSACGKALGAVPQSTVGYEKRFNPMLQLVDDEAAFIAEILSGQPEPPLYFARMKRENRDGPHVLGDLPVPVEIGPESLRNLQAGAQAILDTRPWAKFRAGHVPGSLHIPLGSQFSTLAGSYVLPQEQITLVCEPHQVDEAVRCLVRVGLDRIASFITPAILEAASAAGMKLGATKEIDVAEFRKRLASDEGFVLDVRRATEYDAGHIAGALNIAHPRLAAHLDELPKDQPILVHCQGGVRSAFAAALLERNGFDVTNIAGGFGAYERTGGEVVSGEACAS